MRVIAGSAKGNRLKIVPSKEVRPISDRVKESLFQVIGPFFNGGRVLDLCSGTGAMAIEALSRGMDEAVMIDRSRRSIVTMRENVRSTKFEDKSKIHHCDARLFINESIEEPFDIIFLDPPYDYKDLYPKLLDQLSKSNFLMPSSVVVVKYDKKKCKLPEKIGILRSYRQMIYSDTAITLFEVVSD